jgi:hypothetical protein
LTLSSTGGLIFVANIGSGAGTQTYIGPITLNENITLTSSGGDVVFSGATTTINSTYQSGNPTVTFYTDASAGGTANTWTGTKPSGTWVNNNNTCDFCAWSVNDSVSSLVVGAGTSVTMYQHGGLDGWAQTFDNSAGSSSVTYNLPYVSAYDNEASSFLVSGGGVSAANKTLTINAGGGNVSFGSSVGAGTNGTLGAFAVNSTGTTTFSSTVNATSLSTNTGGSTILTGNVTTSGIQSYSDEVSLAGNVSLSTTNSNILFSSTVDSDATAARDLTLSVGTANITFTGAVGGSRGLGNIALTSTGTSTFSSTVSATSILQNSTTGTTAFNGGSITTSSTQEYRNNVTLGADAALTLTTATFKGTVTGAYGLAITGNAVFGDGTTDTVTLTGSTGNLSVSGTTAINTSTITTSGTQTYTAAVTVNTALTLSASGITTGSTFAVSANALTLTTDAIALGGNLSGTAALVIQPKTARQPSV